MAGTIEDYGDTADPLGSPALGGPGGWAKAVRDYVVNLTNTKVNRAGDAMTGNLTVPTPTASSHAATKGYVDTIPLGLVRGHRGIGSPGVIPWANGDARGDMQMSAPNGVIYTRGIAGIYLCTIQFNVAGPVNCSVRYHDGAIWQAFWYAQNSNAYSFLIRIEANADAICLYWDGGTVLGEDGAGSSWSLTRLSL